jgi:hypothetical protein
MGPTGGGIRTGGAGFGCSGAVVQAAISVATAAAMAIEATVLRDALRGTLRRVEDENIGAMMWMLMMEAGVAMFLLVFIVWWTMFAGRKPEGSREQSRELQRKPQAHAADDTKSNDTDGAA